MSDENILEDMRDIQKSKLRILACEEIFKPNLLQREVVKVCIEKVEKCFKFDFFTRILVLLHGKRPPKTCYTLGRT